MNFILSLVALRFLAVAFAAPEPFDDLRFEVRTLTSMVKHQQVQLASLQAKIGNMVFDEKRRYSFLHHVPNSDFAVDEYDTSERAIKSPISSTLTDRLDELQRRLDESEDLTGQRFETLQSSIDSYRNEVADATRAAYSNVEPVGETHLRQTVFGYVNGSLNQLRISRNDLGLGAKDEQCQVGTVGSRSFPGMLVSYPKVYQIAFQPTFKATPKFTYGIIYLDSDATVRVNVELKTLTKSRATIGVSTWTAHVLFGVEVRWMACP